MKYIPVKYFNIKLKLQIGSQLFYILKLYISSVVKQEIFILNRFYIDEFLEYPKYPM